MTAEVSEVRRCAWWVPTRGAEGKEASYGGGAPPWNGHQVPVKAMDGEICPPLFQHLVFLLNAIFLNHNSNNLFYVFKFLFIGVQFVGILSSARVSFRIEGE